MILKWTARAIILLLSTKKMHSVRRVYTTRNEIAIGTIRQTTRIVYEHSVNGGTNIEIELLRLKSLKKVIYLAFSLR